MKSDRVVAISSLVNRLADVLETKCRYGVFESLLARLLLWRRSDDGNETDYRDHLPSWSWMTYSHIQFHEVESRLKVPTTTNLQFGTDHRILLVQVHRFQKSPMKRRGSKYILRVGWSGRGHFGDLWFDNIDAVYFQYCVIIGIDSYSFMDRKHYYVLLVRERSSNRYERVGLGKVSRACISGERWDGELI